MKRHYQKNRYEKLPPNTKSVKRPSRWGNPFKVELYTLEGSLWIFRNYLDSHPELVAEAKQELAGYDLSCGCPLDQPCHADVWIEYINRPIE